MRYPRCAGLAAPGIPAAGSDIPAAFPLAYPPQALTCRLHSPWHARRIAVIGWLHCPDMRKPPFEMYRMVSNGRFRTLHKCLVGAQTSCWRVGVMLVRRRLTGLRGKKSGPRRMVLGLGRELVLSRDRSGARAVGYRFQMGRSDERSCMSQRQGLNASVQRNSLGPRRMTMRRGPRTCHWSAIGARAVGTGSLVRA